MTRWEKFVGNITPCLGLRRNVRLLMCWIDLKTKLCWFKWKIILNGVLFYLLIHYIAMTTDFSYELHIELTTYYRLQICWSLMWWYELLTRQVHCVAATFLSSASTILQIWRTLSQTLFTRTEIYYVCQLCKISEGFNLVKMKPQEMILSTNQTSLYSLIFLNFRSNLFTYR